MSAPGKRGKWAETQIRNVLMELETAHSGFTFNRIPDAHGGFMQPAAADFQWFFNTGRQCGLFLDDAEGVKDQASYTRNGLIEAKEVEHEYRLDFKNFSPDKVARMWKRQFAGCECMVLVAHKLEGMRGPDVQWRMAPLDFFRGDRPKGVGSWDMRDIPIINFKEVIRGICR